MLGNRDGTGGAADPQPDQEEVQEPDRMDTESRASNTNDGQDKFKPLGNMRKQIENSNERLKAKAAGADVASGA